MVRRGQRSHWLYKILYVLKLANSILMVNVFFPRSCKLRVKPGDLIRLRVSTSSAVYHASTCIMRYSTCSCLLPMGKCDQWIHLVSDPILKA